MRGHALLVKKKNVPRETKNVPIRGTPRGALIHIWGLNWPAIEKNAIQGPCRTFSVIAKSRSSTEVIREDPNQNVNRTEALVEFEARPCGITLEYNLPLQSTLSIPHRL